MRLVDVIKCLIKLGEEPKTILDGLTVDSAEFVVSEFECRPIRELPTMPSGYLEKLSQAAYYPAFRLAHIANMHCAKNIL